MTVAADKSQDMTIRDTTPRPAGGDGRDELSAAMGSIYVIESLGVKSSSLSLVY